MPVDHGRDQHLPDLIERGSNHRGNLPPPDLRARQMAEWSKQPIVMARADGVCYWDVHGKRYLDAISGIYVVSVGHNNRRVHRRDQAAARRADVFAADARDQSAGRATGQPAGRARRPGDLSTVKFQCGGAEVIEAAIKLARQYHQAHRLTRQVQDHQPLSIVARLDPGPCSASGLKSRKTVNEPMAPGFLHVFPPTCYRCPFGKTYPDCGITCATIVERRDRDGRPVDRGGHPGRADRPHRRRDRSPRRVSADPSRDLRPASHPLDLR